MTVSLMAARLLSNAYYHKDYTGWPDWVRMDDGVWMTQLFLSVSRRRMVYSVVVKARDARKDQCIFVLCMDQVAKGMEPYHNKVGIMGVLLSEQEGDNRLVISIDYGEHIVLDVVNQAAVRSLEGAAREAHGFGGRCLGCRGAVSGGAGGCRGLSLCGTRPGRASGAARCRSI